MVNKKPEVIAALKSICGIRVCFQYPDDWNDPKKFPVVSYYELSNTIGIAADDEEYASKIAIQVDVWADSSSECSDIAVKVDKEMSSVGFIREMSRDLPDPSKKFRKTMRFTGLFPEESED